MRYPLFLLLLLSVACTREKHFVIVDESGIHPSALTQLDADEHHLLEGYLYLYGNACQGEKPSVKCRILQELHVRDECNPAYRKALEETFALVPVMKYKFSNCPVLKEDAAIQNHFIRIEMTRRRDRHVFSYAIQGINQAQEKTWNISGKDTFDLINHQFKRRN